MAEEHIIPFKDGLEHLLAEMQVICRQLTEKVSEMTQRFESELESPFKGYGITPTEALYYLRKVEEDDGKDKRFSCDPKIVETLTLRREKSLNEEIFLPFVNVQQLFRLSRFEAAILLTCLLPEFYPGLGRVFGFLQDDAMLSYPTMGFLMELYCNNHKDRELAWQIFHPGSPLKTWQLIVSIGDERQLPPLKRAYRVDERIVTYLMGSSRYDGRLEGIISLNTVRDSKGIVSYQAIFESIVNEVKNGRECQIITLTGNDRDSAYNFVEATVKQLGWSLLKVSLSTLFHQREWNITLVDVLLREAVLQPAAILLYEEERIQEFLPNMIPLLRIFARKGILIFYRGNTTLSVDSIEPTINYIKLEFQYLRPSERLAYWKKAIEKRELNWSDNIVEQLVMRYPMSEKQVNIIFERLRLRMNGNGDNAEQCLDLFKQVINDYTQQPLDELAHHIDPIFDWNDLVVHKSVANHLQAFRNTIAHPFTVYEKWGLGTKIQRGRGVIALFSGPSGTGKTMAAEVIAHELGMNLYRIDLAGLVSKYIGETEKNIKRIFDSARGANVLLFFDEADALFGKRTEIRDSHDRYANLEVSYLLQRIEEHDGPVILASNMRKNMDEAFLRRIHFIIEFPQPPESLRQTIWQKYLPASVPKAKNVDMPFLAKHFEMSGGEIRNAAVQAAFLAAEDGGQVTMEHVLMSIKREYLKVGKIFPGSQVNHISKALSESPQNRRRKKQASRSPLDEGQGGVNLGS